MIRPIRRIDTSTRFEKEFNRLSKHIKKLAYKKDALFRKDAFHPLLKTHKLHGALKDDWAYSVNEHYRVRFYFVDNDTVVYINIGRMRFINKQHLYLLTFYHAPRISSGKNTQHWHHCPY